MKWIADVVGKHGPKVRLISAQGHKHWGFIVGQVYEIKDGRFYGKFDEAANDLANKVGVGPSSNWGNWEFVKARPVQLENK